MRSRLISEEPFRSLCDREWKRAKAMYPMRLKRKPKFFWADSIRLGGAYGRCNRTRNFILMRHTYKKFTDQKEFVLLLRHEIAHLLPRPLHEGSHGKTFTEVNTRLGGTRWATSFKELTASPAPTE